MTLQVSSDQCQNCGGRLVINQGEEVCQSCGIVTREKITDLNPVSYTDNNEKSTSHHHQGLGTKINKLNEINSNLKRFFKNGLIEKTQEETEEKKKAVIRANRIFNESIIIRYHQKELEDDTKTIRKEILFLTKRLGDNLDRDLVFQYIQNFIKQKIKEKPHYKQYFNLKILQNKRRWLKRDSSNISGVGNQINSKRDRYDKEGHCYLCGERFDPHNWATAHWKNKHSKENWKNNTGKINSPFHFKTKHCIFYKIVEKKPKQKEGKRYGLCIKCNFQNAKMQREKFVRRKGKQAGKTIEQLYALHDGKRCFIREHIVK
jgi:transcription initiation factor TFIIIB Brf1 subunit/transcription initiation factor TFIIB